MVLDAAPNDMVRRATKNIHKIKYLPVDGLNVFDVLKYDHVVLAKAAIEGVVSKCLATEKA